MRAAGITALGEPVEIFEVDELATPAADEVMIDVAAAGIGNWDELVRVGSWQIGGPAPMALGTEAAGTVAAAGSAVTDVREGDEVITHPLPLRRHRTWARRGVIPGAAAPKAVTAAGGRAGGRWQGVAEGGPLATTPGAPPQEIRGVAISDVYVRPDGRQLSALAELLALGTLSVPLASVRPLEEAAEALREVVAGADGAIVLSLRT